MLFQLYLRPQSDRAVEYANSISADGLDHYQQISNET